MEFTQTLIRTCYHKGIIMNELQKPKIVEVVGKYTYGLGEPVEGFEIKTSHYCDLHTDKRYIFENQIFKLIPPKVILNNFEKIE